MSGQALGGCLRLDVLASHWRLICSRSASVGFNIRAESHSCKQAVRYRAAVVRSMETRRFGHNYRRPPTRQPIVSRPPSHPQHLAPIARFCFSNARLVRTRLSFPKFPMYCKVMQRQARDPKSGWFHQTGYPCVFFWLGYCSISYRDISAVGSQPGSTWLDVTCRPGTAKCKMQASTDTSRSIQTALLRI